MLVCSVSSRPPYFTYRVKKICMRQEKSTDMSVDQELKGRSYLGKVAYDCCGARSARSGTPDCLVKEKPAGLFLYLSQ